MLVKKNSVATAESPEKDKKVFKKDEEQGIILRASDSQKQEDNMVLMNEGNALEALLWLRNRDINPGFPESILHSYESEQKARLQFKT